MSLRDDLQRAASRVARAALGLLRPPPVAAPTDRTPGRVPHGARAMRQVPTLSAWDAEDVLAALRAHAAGNFRASALLADYLGQSDAVAGVLDTLRRSVVGLPFDVTVPADTPDPTRSAALARDWRCRWPHTLSRGAAGEILKWSCLMGFAVCERVWRLDPRTGLWDVRLKPWHPTFMRWDWQRGCVVVSTQEGEEYVTTDNPKWCLFTDIEESRPWMSGAVRPIGILALIVWWLDRDGARWSEKHGLPPLGAKVPMEQSEDPRTDRFLSDLEDLGTEPIMRLPQGSNGAASFDIEWKELKNATAWQGFLEPGRDVRSRIATVMLGQPLTTTAGVGGSGSYALGRVHASVRQDVMESYAALLGTARAHAIVPWMTVNETPDRRLADALAPVPVYDAAPPADAKADAEASRAEADAVRAWEDAGVPVDAVALAKARGLPLRPPDPAPLDADPIDDAPLATVERAVPNRYGHINFRPPQGVRAACKRGIELHEAGLSGDGLQPDTVAWARRLARGENVSPEKARKMARWFGRNRRFADAPKDSPAWVSFCLWGGHAGDAWSSKLVRQMNAADNAT